MSPRSPGSRAPAQDAYPPGSRLAERANDPNETRVQFDLYRVPFNGGQGGRAEPIAGAAGNGMSNSFPKVSPDGRWIVFVQARNGQLMRPDSQLYIVPASGGQARRMRCNTPLMNSWHSFSPNGRWLVFSSKSRSPYTQMFLTHIDEQGRAAMVDTSAKDVTARQAIASGRVLMSAETVQAIRDHQTPKGDPLETARLAGIIAAKPRLVTPIAHPTAITQTKSPRAGRSPRW